MTGMSQEKTFVYFPVDTTYTLIGQYQKFKSSFPNIMPAVDKTPVGVKEEREIVYAVTENSKFGKRDLHIDIFMPEAKRIYPTLIMIHGGGWRAGNKSLQIPMAQKIASEGFVTVAIEYQLALEAGYPSAIHNIKAAIRWLRANAAKYSIDTQKIAISGCSAGGHLASLVGMTNGLAQFEGKQGNASYSSAVQAIINIDGIVDFLAPASLNKTRTIDSPDIQWLGGFFKDIPDIWKEASPIFYASEKTVPILFINSGFSRYHAGQDELTGMLKEWGIYFEVHKFNVEMHTFWLFHPYMDETVQYMVDFMKKTLK